jgi:hypothetical protein
MSASPLSHLPPLTSEQWEDAFVTEIKKDFQTHDDLLISQLLDSQDNTLPLVADHVRRYVTNFWTETNEDRSLFGAEMRQKLPSAIAGQKTTIGILEALIARFRRLNLSSPDVNPQYSLQVAQTLLAQLEFMQNRAPDAFNVKPMGTAGDLQTLYSLACLLNHRLGKIDYDTLATLLDCGRMVEGQDKEVEDGKNLKNRLDSFRENKPEFAKDTEASVRSLPRK